MIGNIEFKTKKECENFTRTKITELGCCKINKENIDYMFFYELLNNHPKFETKIGTGIDYFYIQKNKLNPKSYQTMIKRVDGTYDDFSWVYCCKFKERTTIFYLLRAMRQTISIDTIEYKKNNKLICAICNNSKNAYHDYHVDHKYPSFNTISNNFIELNTPPTTFNHSTQITTFNEKDNIFKKNWYNYHKQNSSFQILCSHCNTSKGCLA